MWDYNGLISPHFGIGPEISIHFLKQPDAKPITASSITCTSLFFSPSPACTSRCFKQVARLDYLFVCNVLYSSYHLVWPRTKIVTVVTGGKSFPLRTICYYEKKRIELGREEFGRILNKLRETNGNIRDMHYSPS